jgi:hypothetical protein
LRIDVEVTGGPPGVTNTATLNALVSEFEANGGNNTANANLPIS